MCQVFSHVFLGRSGKNLVIWLYLSMCHTDEGTVAYINFPQITQHVNGGAGVLS